MKFPNNFLWGGATSAAQYEGDYNTNNKGLSVMDVMTQGSHSNPREIHDEILDSYRYPNHIGVKGIEHIEEDVELMVKAGFKAYRFSIAWTRIFPNGYENEPNIKGFEYYDRLINLLNKNNIESVITLSHFDMPLSLAKKGGWLNRETVKYFESYCLEVLNRYKGKVKYWMVFNEINNVSTMPWMAAGIKESSEELKMFAAYHQLLANSKIIKQGKSICEDYKFGLMYNSHFTYPASTDPEDIQGTMTFMHQMLFYADVMCKGYYPNYKLKELERLNIELPILEGDLEEMKNGVVDFVSFSYYLTHVTGKKTQGILKGLNGLITGYKNEHLEASDWGFSINPQGIRHTCNFLFERYNLPLMISENGLGALDEVINGEINDDYRIDYLKKHILELGKAINEDGVEILGYMMWSPFDIVSASTGELKKRYGLIYIDYNDLGEGTFKRIPKKSYYWYKDVIEKNGIDI